MSVDMNLMCLCFVPGSLLYTTDNGMYACSHCMANKGKPKTLKEIKERTQGVKNDTNKPRMELLSHVAMLEIAKVMGFGAAKYSSDNWRSGFAWRRLIGAAMRHLSAYSDGEDKDPESGISHLAHVGCCIMFLLEHEIKGLGTDDRYKREEQAATKRND